MPIIVLEGIDGSGKSTLAEQILKLSPIKASIVHRGPLKGSVQDELITPLLEVPDDELMICDRWHVGELIYGPIYRGRSQVKGMYERQIERILASKAAVRVIVMPPLEVVKQRLEIRGEDYLQPEHVDQVHQAYVDFWTANPAWIGISNSDPNTAERLLNLALGVTPCCS